MSLISVPLTAQPQAPASGEVVWTHGRSGELDSLRVRYENMVRREGKKNSDDARDLQRAIETAESRPPWVLSFDFPGGPLSRFLVLIAKADVVPFSVINTGDPSDLETVRPPLALRNASIRTVRDVRHNLLLARGRTFNPADGSNDLQMVTVLPRLAPRGFEIKSADEFVALLKERLLLVLPQNDGSKQLVLLEQ